MSDEIDFLKHENAHLRYTLWLAVHAAGGKVTITKDSVLDFPPHVLSMDNSADPCTEDRTLTAKVVRS